MNREGRRTLRRGCQVAAMAMTTPPERVAVLVKWAIVSLTNPRP